MEFAVVEATERNSELIANPTAEWTGLNSEAVTLSFLRTSQAQPEPLF
jgi:hypothetical protein